MAIISLIDFSFNVRNKKDNGMLLLNVFDVTLLFQKDRYFTQFSGKLLQEHNRDIIANCYSINYFYFQFPAN